MKRTWHVRHPHMVRSVVDTHRPVLDEQDFHDKDGYRTDAHECVLLLAQHENSFHIGMRRLFVLCDMMKVVFVTFCVDCVVQQKVTEAIDVVYTDRIRPQALSHEIFLFLRPFRPFDIVEPHI